MRKLELAVLLAGLVAVCTASPRLADASATSSESNGSLSDSGRFTLSGSNLTVQLTNTSSADVLDPTDVLTGIGFNLNSGTLTPVSASVGSSTVYYGSFQNAVGEGWRYNTGVSFQ